MEKKIYLSRAQFRSTDLWVMGPARFHCATLLLYYHNHYTSLDFRIDYGFVESKLISLFLQIIRHQWAIFVTKVAWPSGLRRWFKAPVSSEAWVRIPPLPTTFLYYYCYYYYFFFFFKFYSSNCRIGTSNLYN